MAITLSSPNNISSPRGNSLALYKDASTGKYFVKDIYGKIENFEDVLNDLSGYKAVQKFRWINGTATPYYNIPNGVRVTIPYDEKPFLQKISGSNLNSLESTYVWGGTYNGLSGTSAITDFTLGSKGEGTWSIKVLYFFFDQTNNAEINGWVTINGVETDIVSEKTTELTINKMFYGEYIGEFVSGDVVSVGVEFIGGGVNPFPSDSGNSSPQVWFTRVVD